MVDTKFTWTLRALYYSSMKFAALSNLQTTSQQQSIIGLCQGQWHLGIMSKASNSMLFNFQTLLSTAICGYGASSFCSSPIDTVLTSSEAEMPVRARSCFRHSHLSSTPLTHIDKDIDWREYSYLSMNLINQPLSNPQLEGPATEAQ